jgi:hypothetical protein
MIGRQLVRRVLTIKQWEAPGFAGCFPLLLNAVWNAVRQALTQLSRLPR